MAASRPQTARLADTATPHATGRSQLPPDRPPVRSRGLEAPRLDGSCMTASRMGQD
jgi:hypothetical protein